MHDYSLTFSDLWKDMKKKRSSESAIPEVKWPYNTKQAHKRRNRSLNKSLKRVLY